MSAKISILFDNKQPKKRWRTRKKKQMTKFQSVQVHKQLVKLKEISFYFLYNLSNFLFWYVCGLFLVVVAVLLLLPPLNSVCIGRNRKKNTQHINRFQCHLFYVAYYLFLSHTSNAFPIALTPACAFALPLFHRL